MMTPWRHPETTNDIGKPEGWEDERDGECVTLPCVVSRGPIGMIYTSFYKPSADELARLNRGEPVRLSIYATAHPVIGIDVTTMSLAEQEKATKEYYAALEAESKAMTRIDLSGRM